ncbi:MAG: TonB family protein, partial [Fibromonadales bacterium]|nr:TonB family protein [Fibromonadales bacterium]
MKSKNLPLIVAASALLLAVLCFLILTTEDGETQEPKKELKPQEVFGNMPVLKMDGKENSNVYLQSLDIQVEVIGNIASTRYTMVFKNRTSGILEGELTFPLPEGRTVTHYALDINGRMRDAVPVEKARATQVFEEIEQRKVDPGLLERVEGNNFRTRIYPIPANGARTISIGYEEELTLENDSLYYRLPINYPDSLEKFSAKATIFKHGEEPVVKNYQHSSALVFALPASADIPQVIMQPAQGSHYFLASVAPKMESRKKQWDSSLAIIWDVSLSASQRNLQKEIEMLSAVFAEQKNVNMHLYFLNNRFKKVASGSYSELKKFLETAVYDGGTDFSQINLDDVAGNEILFFSDGISTLGDGSFLSKANRPVHCFVSSPKADYSAMKLIADKTKGEFINFNAMSFDKLKDLLMNETLQFLGTEHGSEVREVYPSIASPVYGNFSVAGISDTNDTEMTLLFGFGNNVEKRIKIKLDSKNSGNEANVHKIWAQKKIAELDLDYEKNYDELAELGKHFGIVTRNISLIVLEAIFDYVRYNIEPPATEPDLQAEYQRRVPSQNKSNKTVLKQLTAKTSTQNFSAYSLMKDNAFAKNILGDRKAEELGGRRASAEPASGSGSIGSRGTLKAPGARDIDMGSGDGSRSKAEIMAVVNARQPGLRHVYNKHLKSRPFSGKVTLKWTIAASGDVISISIVSSTTGYKEFDEAIKNMVATWKWKAIKSGNTTPTIPFNFTDDSVTSDLIMLGNAIGAIENIKEWQNIEFTLEKAKYPMPDEREKAPEMDSSKVYLSKLTGKTNDDYQTYLKLRNDYASSPVFYFDMSNWFYKLGDRETALRILTSIAELELENASHYRLLGYKFKEYGEHALQKFVCQKVIEWRPMEIQSYRDYALALADNGEEQAALDSLYGLLTKPYSRNIISRSSGIEEVVAMEINNLIAKNKNLNTSKIDKRLLLEVPVDIRIVINWNTNNTDINLSVKDPNNEECSFKNKRTNIGGRISADNANGYGPEQFMLKKAIKGKYKVYAN